MKVIVDRRDMLKVALGGAVGLSLPIAGGILPAFGQTAGMKVTRLSDRVIMVSGDGGNVVAAKCADGVLMVDGGLEAQAEDLLHLVATQMGSDNVHTLFNTHWHPEQTGSNKLLAKRGTHIIAQANTKLWLGTDITPPYENKTYHPLPKEARPAEIFYTDWKKTVGDLEVKAGYMLQAHTDGDIYVHFPSENVLVGGGPLSNAGWPYMDWWTGGWIGGLADALGTLYDLSDDKTIAVPANGGVMAKADLARQHKMYSDLFTKLRTDLFGALSPAESVAKQPAKDYVAEMGDPEQFLTLSFQSLWGHFSPDA